MNKHTTPLRSIFYEFQKIPKGILIDRPDELIQTGFSVHPVIMQIFSRGKLQAFFTRRTLKHLAEKGVEGKRLLGIIPNILEYPDVIFRGKKTRLLSAKFFNQGKKREPHIIVIEFLERGVILVTSFVTDEKYLKNFEILWRTGGSLS